jgi:hypothetical protein
MLAVPSFFGSFNLLYCGRRFHVVNLRHKCMAKTGCWLANQGYTGKIARRTNRGRGDVLDFHILPRGNDACAAQIKLLDKLFMKL